MPQLLLKLEGSAATTSVSAINQRGRGLTSDGKEAAARGGQLALAVRLASLRLAQPIRVANPFALTTPRLELRPMRASDRAEFLRVLSDSRQHLSRFCPLHKVSEGGERIETDEQVFERQLALSNAAMQTGKAWRRAAFTREGRLVGAFHLNDIMRGLEHSAELVFWLARDRTGQGYAGEAVKAVLDFAFEEMPKGLGLHRVCALVAPANMPCAKLLSGLGMTLQNHLPPVELMLSGKPEAHDLFVKYAPQAEAAGAVSLDLNGHGQIREIKNLARSLESILRTETDLEASHHGVLSSFSA